MEKTMHKFFFLLALVAFPGCKNRSDNTVHVDSIPREGIILKNWQVLGPFPANGEVNYLDRDNLEFFGYSESTIEYREFVAITKIDAKQGIPLLDNFDNKRIESPDFLVDINKVFGYLQMEQSISGNAYLACNIKSDEDKIIRLDFTSDDGAKVWLNHEQIIRIEKSESIIDYENYPQLKLKKGNNFLLVKVNNGMFDWQMFAKLEQDSVEGLRRYKSLLARLNNHNFFTSSFLDTCNYLIMSEKLPASKYFIWIRDDKENIVFKDTMDTRIKRNIDLSPLKEGIYSAYLYLNNDTLHQILFKGDVINKTNEVIVQLNMHNHNAKLKNRIDARIHRFSHLLKPNNRGSNISARQFWERKIINVYVDLKNILTNLKCKNEPIKNIPGTHIGTYVSEIDNQVQYYLVHIPINYRKELSYPLMFFMPAKLNYHQPYLESMRVADQKLIENLQDLADKYNICVLEPFCREVGKFNFNSIEETDFFEALHSVKEEYNIDTTRMYLSGSCEGAYKALKFAVRFPTLFAAVGVIAPTFTSASSSNDWLSYNEPLNFIKNIGNIPFYIIHSKLDKHISVKNSDAFFDRARKEGLTNVHYRRLDDVIDLYYWYQYSNDLVCSLIKNKLCTAPHTISFSTRQLKYSAAYWMKILQFDSQSLATIEANIVAENVINITSENIFSYSVDVHRLPFRKNKPVEIIENGKTVFKGEPAESTIVIRRNESMGLLKTSIIEGPFAHALTHKFIIVIGHSGTRNENSALKVLSDSIRAYWKYKYLNDCLTKYDYEITDSDIREANLIVLGNNNSNTVLKNLQDKLPLLITDEYMRISHERISGRSLGFYMVYPNPLNTNKYIALIGYNNAQNISLGKLDMDDGEYKKLINYLQNVYYTDISCYGWFDYKVWDAVSLQTLCTGYFNYSWN